MTAPSSEGAFGKVNDHLPPTGIPWAVGFALYLFLLYCLDDQQGEEHHNERYGQDDPCVLNKAGKDVAYKGYACAGQCIGQLGVHMVDVVTLAAGGCHDGGIGDGGTMVTADSAGQTGGNGNHHQLTAGEHAAHDGQQHTKGAPGGAGGESQAGADEEHDGRQEVCQMARGVTDEFSNKHGSAQLTGDAGQCPSEGEDQHSGDHGLKAVSKGSGELLEGDDPPGQVQHSRENQCQNAAKNQAHRCIAVRKSIDKTLAFEETAGVDHAHHAAHDQRHDGQHQIQNRALGVTFFVGGIGVGTGVGGVQIAVLGVLLMDTHGTIIELHQRHGDDHEQRQQRVKIIGNGLDEQCQALTLGGNAGNRGGPGGDGCDDADRRCGGIDDVRKLCPGDVVLVGDGAHDGANRQTVEVIVHEDQHSQHRGGDDGAHAALDMLACPAAVCGRAAGFVDEGDHHAQGHQEDHDTHIPAVAELSDHHIKGIGDHTPGVKVGVDQRTGEDAHEQGEVDLLGDQRQGNGNDRGQQRPEGSVGADGLTDSCQRLGDVVGETGVGAYIFVVAFQIAQSLVVVRVICRAGTDGKASDEHDDQHQQKHTGK